MLSQLQARALSWWHETPLPEVALTKSKPVFQKWHGHSHGRWSPYLIETPYPGPSATDGVQKRWESVLHMVTWNIDAGAPSPEARTSALLCTIEEIAHMTTSYPPVDIIFFQEVSRPALNEILRNTWIQQNWIASEVDDSKFGRQTFATVTLLSKSCLSDPSVSLGRIWRVPLPSRFDRDALCCDLLLNNKASLVAQSRNSERTSIRLINVHLDSLPINPSLRPAQMLVVDSYIRRASCGLIAGDFNPVLPEDAELVEQHNLIDAWESLHPTDPGYTWGVDGKQAFPPSRLDKVVMHKVEPQENPRVACLQGYWRWWGGTEQHRHLTF